ncbi:hypothetical protein [Streptomyces tsukubensis]|uniref:hypothetical protein n=1 Tax=Streptomyces tsukubensis TaxID=83656 RepID=UPI00344C4F16
MMRVLESTFEPVTDELDEETREALAVLAIDGYAERTTSCTDSDGQQDIEVTLRGFTAPDGQDRWAVVSSGADYRSVWDGADRAEAEARYEEEVRDLADCTSTGSAPWWTRSDVSGVAHAAFTVTVERLVDGEWHGGDESFDAHLGRAFEVYGLYAGPIDLDTLDQASAEGTAAHLAEAQSSINDSLELADAAGYPMPGVPASAVRVTLMGVTAEGPAEFTAEAPAPTAEPTAAQITAARRTGQSVDDELAAEACAPYRD